jgi:hypothetical protein
LATSDTPSEEANKPTIPEVEVKEHPNFRTINVGGVFGGPLDMRFELTIFSQHYAASDAYMSGQTTDPLKYSRTLECRLVVDPFNLKAIVHWLTGQLSEFEAQYGNIPTPEERQQREIAIGEKAKRKTNGVL